jgi:DNA polymerase-3 subunit alpha
VGRSLDIPLGEVDRIAKLVPEGPNVSLSEAIKEEPELKKLETAEGSAKKLLQISRGVEGLARHASTHACGVVIADQPLVNYLPLFKGPKDEIMTQFTMELIEKLGLIKFDFLGLKTLTVIKEALKLIRETTGTRLNIDKIPMDDPATYQLCSDGKTTGVFQLESSGMKELLRKLRPGVFEDMIALVALYRPGPLGSNMVEDFINGKHGNGKIKYFLPQLEPILKETYGVILYQEQVMKIAQVLASYTMAEADELRKAVGKKKPEVMAKHRARFVEGAKQNKVKPETAEMLFSLIKKFGGYGFNKSHSAAYALIAYQTAYLKSHYPVQFMAALLTLDMDNQDKTIKNIAESREMGIEILPPDVNESEADFSVVEGKIRFGLAAVKNVGMKAVETVIEERNENGPFSDLVDFCKRVDGSKVNRRVLEGLIQCGAFDFTNIYRSRLLASLENVLKFCCMKQDPNQLNIFGSANLFDNDMETFFDMPDIDEWDESDRLRREKEALGFYITGHPLARFAEEIMLHTTCANQDISVQRDKSQAKIVGVVEKLKIKRTKKGDKMAVFSLEDMTGSVEIIVFPDLFTKMGHLLKGEEPLFITGNIERGDSTSKVIAQDIETIQSVRQKAIKAVELNLAEENVSMELLEDLVDITFKYPGDCRLFFRVENKGGDEFLISAGDRFKIMPCHEFLREVEVLTGTKVNELM